MDERDYEEEEYWKRYMLEEAEAEQIEQDMPRCQPIGCDAGHHLPGCTVEGGE